MIFGGLSFKALIFSWSQNESDVFGGKAKLPSVRHTLSSHESPVHKRVTCVPLARDGFLAYQRVTEKGLHARTLLIWCILLCAQDRHQYNSELYSKLHLDTHFDHPNLFPFTASLFYKYVLSNIMVHLGYTARRTPILIVDDSAQALNM